MLLPELYDAFDELVLLIQSRMRRLPFKQTGAVLDLLCKMRSIMFLYSQEESLEDYNNCLLERMENTYVDLSLYIRTIDKE